MLEKVKNYINPYWLFSLLVLGLILSFFNGFIWGIKVTIIISLFMIGYRSGYPFLIEMKAYLIDKKWIDKKEVTLKGLVTLICLLLLFFITKDNGTTLLMLFGVLLLLSIISQVIIDKLDS